jgi:hypothetical protein
METVEIKNPKGRPRTIPVDESIDAKKQRSKVYTDRYREKNKFRISVNAIDKKLICLATKLQNLTEKRDNLISLEKLNLEHV